VPVIVCTAAARQVEEFATHLDEMGVAVVLKPFDIDYLLAEIALVRERGSGTANERAAAVP
jgi:DNA-binding response OmpR family regulator